MGEEVKEEEKPKPKEEKAPETAAAAEGKKEGGGEGEKKEGDGGGEKAAEGPPLPPEEVVMRVYMHCEGCARKVKRCLKGFEGVEDVSTDSKAHKVVVKGKKAAEDPMKVVDRVQKKTGRKVELLSPVIPPPKKPDEKKKEEEEEKKKEEQKEEKKEEKKEPQVITVVLKVHMHCEACAQEIKKRILKMKGVQSAEPDLKASQVSVKGIFDPPTKLVEYVYKRTGKHATIVKTDPPTDGSQAATSAEGEMSKEDGKSTEKKVDEKKEEDQKKDENKKEENAGGEAKKDGELAGDDDSPAGNLVKMERMLHELYQRQNVGYATGYAYNQYPPQIFSDENPNACSVM